jgi:hypothetical protein
MSGFEDEAVLDQSTTGFDHPLLKWSVHRSIRDDVDLRGRAESNAVPATTIAEPNSCAQLDQYCRWSYSGAKIKMMDIGKHAVCPLLFAK